MGGFKYKKNGQWMDLQIPSSINLDSFTPEDVDDIKKQLFNIRKKMLCNCTPAVQVKAVEDGLYTAVQGGATDGSFLYFYRMSGDDSNWMIVKYDPATDSIIASRTGDTSSAEHHWHGNDITYNSKTGYLYLVEQWSESGTSISKINPETLEQVEQISLERGISALAYDAANNRYVGCSSTLNQLYILDGELSLVRIVGVPVSEYVSQGAECDENYIYILKSRTANSNRNFILVYDWYGNYIGEWELPCNDAFYEVEFMAKINDNTIYYGACNKNYNGYTLYKSRIKNLNYLYEITSN